jgi:hypothetical protein
MLVIFSSPWDAKGHTLLTEETVLLILTHFHFEFCIAVLEKSENADF